jgi:hypothetical protein
MFAVGVDCPSLVNVNDSPVDSSVIRLLNMVDEMTVPVTTGIPLVVTTNVPDPLKGITSYPKLYLIVDQQPTILLQQKATQTLWNTYNSAKN